MELNLLGSRGSKEMLCLLRQDNAALVKKQRNSTVWVTRANILAIMSKTEYQRAFCLSAVLIIMWTVLIWGVAVCRNLCKHVIAMCHCLMDPTKSQNWVFDNVFYYTKQQHGEWLFSKWLQTEDQPNDRNYTQALSLNLSVKATFVSGFSEMTRWPQRSRLRL